MSDNEIDFDPDGFLANPDDWSVELAREIAAQAGIEPLTEDHWKVITRLRKHYLDNRQIPVMRHICREAGLETHCVSDLLVDPALAWRIAGLPNPGEEAKAYLENSEIRD
jgi:tRNA 2-thiouridine synthesizing protein E